MLCESFNVYTCENGAFKWIWECVSMFKFYVCKTYMGKFYICISHFHTKCLKDKQSLGIHDNGNLIKIERGDFDGTITFLELKFTREMD